MIGEDFEKKCKRDQGRVNVDVSEDTKRGIYSKSSPWLDAIDDHWMSNTDLEQVKINLMKNAEHGATYHPLQKRVMINFTKEACGWVREVKFQKYLEWNYKNYSKIVDRRWFDMNTLEKYAIGMAPHKIYFPLE